MSVGALNVFELSKMAFSMNSRAANIANVIFMCFLLLVVINAVNLLLVG